MIVLPLLPKHNFFKNEMTKALATNIAFRMFGGLLKMWLIFKKIMESPNQCVINGP
jgi:hypothetical protein